MTLQEKAARFAAMHVEPGIIVLPNAWDPGSAMLMQDAGFPAIATTSSGIAFSQGLPDGEAIGRERMLEICARIAQAVKVPVTFDLEAGYGPAPEDVATTVRGAIAAGAVGCNIEDGQHDASAPLAEFARSAERIRAGVEAAKSSGQPFVLNARTDAFLFRPKHADNFAETVKRGIAYREAGARCVFIPGVEDPALIERLQREIGGPINLMAARGGRKSALTVAEYAKLGVKRISIGGSLAEAVLALTHRAAREVREQGTFGFAANAMTHFEATRIMTGKAGPA